MKTNVRETRRTVTPAEAVRLIKKHRSCSIRFHIGMDMPTEPRDPNADSRNYYPYRACVKVTRREAIRQLEDWQGFSDRKADKGDARPLLDVHVSEWAYSDGKWTGIIYIG